MMTDGQIRAGGDRERLMAGDAATRKVLDGLQRAVEMEEKFVKLLVSCREFEDLPSSLSERQRARISAIVKGVLADSERHRVTVAAILGELGQ